MKNDKLIENINKINQLSELEFGWDGYNAEPFSNVLLNHCLFLIIRIISQPEIFPTGKKSIQFEYEKENGDYLEFEIFEDRIEVFQILNTLQEVSAIFPSYNIKKINDMIVNFLS